MKARKRLPKPRRLQLILLTLAALVAGPAVSASQPARAAAAQAAVSLSQSPVEDTASGYTRTLDMPGGGYAAVRSSGAISMVNASGAPRWQVDTRQLYQDWDLTWKQQSQVTNYPQLAWGTDPADPLEFTGAGGYGALGLVNDVNPAAAGKLNGRPVVAVAATVGVPLSASGCPSCTWPFSVPGSGLTLGTFVSVMDAATGRMLYHELDPGYVTQLAIAGDRLIVGAESGDPQTANGIGQWGSVSTVRGLAIAPNGTARQAWRYSTGVPWGRLLDVAATGGPDGTASGTGTGIAVAWSDTPTGLGEPGPPEGHVLLLDAATGAVRWQVRTPGYPVLTAADDQRRELAVVQQADPYFGDGYTLTGLSYATGRTVLTDKRDGAFPLSLAVGSGPDDGWAVGALDATGSYGSYAPTVGRVTLASAVTGHDLWSVTQPQFQDYSPLANEDLDYPPIDDGVLVAGGTVITAAYLDSPSPTLSVPVMTQDRVTALDYRTGRTRWQQTGDIGDPVSLSPVADGSGLVRAVNSRQVVETFGAGGQVTQSTAGPGDFLSGVTASVSADKSTDLVAGNEDGDVYAFGGKALAAGRQDVLWRTHLPGPVQHLETATLAGRQVVVAAASSAIGVIDAVSGRLLRVIPTPGTYAYTATAISAGSVPAVVVPGASLTAYSLASGARLWSYAAPSGAHFSDAAYAHGVVAAEYSSAMANASDGGYTPAAYMAAVGVSAATGALAWSAPADPADPSDVVRGQLYNGTFASPDITGADGDGVAFLWQDSLGGGTAGDEVDVRNIVTGALDYSDSSGYLNSFYQFVASPSLGLVGIGQNGGAQITPSGAKNNYNVAGTSGAVATTASGQQALLVADGGVSAFGTDAFATISAQAQASGGGYLSGTLVAGDFSGNGTEQAVAMATNVLTPEIVNESTYAANPWFSDAYPSYQDGLSVITVRDTAVSSAVQSPAGQEPAPWSVRPVDPASSASLGSPAGSDSSVGSAKTGSPVSPGHSATAGSLDAPGSHSGPSNPGTPASVPTLEPKRVGLAVPAASPATVKHTVTAGGADPAVTPPGYSPSQLNGYLGLTGDGNGQTIAIVDAYDNGDIVPDTETFSQQYGLPGVCGAGGTAGDCFHLDVREQSAATGVNGDAELETSLDVEWVHALAPKATIELFEASDLTFADMFAEVATAVATHPAAISMSWGENGGDFSDETYYDHFCAVTTTVCVVSSGDYGHPGSYPAYSPAALSVGGTTLNLAADDSVTSEQAWADSGGGQSWVEPEPAYQDKVQSSGKRQLPDVSFDADVNTGVAVYDSIPYYGQTGWFQVGGTSVGAPAWSAILADADQLRAGTGGPSLAEAGATVQKAVYSLPTSVLAPVTSGPDNGFCPVGCAPGPGYDEITGLGSPRAGIDAVLARATG